MKNALLFILLFFTTIFSLFGESKKAGFDFKEFGKIPVLLDGRIKPIDTVARTSLRLLHDKQTLRTEEGKLTAIQWLAELLISPDSANQQKVFSIHDQEVLDLLKLEKTKEHNYSFSQIEPSFVEIDRQADLTRPIEEQDRSYFQKNLLKLRHRLILYQRLKNSLQSEDSPDFQREVEMFALSIEGGLEAIQKREEGETFDQTAFSQFIAFGSRYQTLAQTAYFFVAPPMNDSSSKTDWLNNGEALLRSIVSKEIHPVTQSYTNIIAAYQNENSDSFNLETTKLLTWFEKHSPTETRKSQQETFFNNFQPFYRSIVLYILAFLFACASWLIAPQKLGKTAFYLCLLAFIIHTAGLGFRMYLEGRPPVTTLYSAAIFVGWGAALLGIILESIFKNGIGSAVASAIGFCSLILAHNLSGSGDTMVMMRAVLDSNFWLATHVVVITLGYSATYLAGFLGLVYVGRGVFTKTLDKKLAASLARMIYGIICFATLFSFVGTVLGGIWADQSWGRFWGWDPKENGAVLIVLWNAIILHARWGGYIKARGLVNMAIFGNIITTWSFFGTNMLGVGLHSYGFMDSGFIWMISFMISQLVMMAVASLPLHIWRSQREREN
jgi:ABC-type transport system involved in cytochrome c biogenesis permease subunit